MSGSGDLLGPVRNLRAMFSSSGGAELIPQARLSGPMPWVIAIMVALTVIALAAGLALRNAAETARDELEGGITVQVIEARPDVREQETQAVLATLDGLEQIRSVHRVPAERVDALIEPWLGSGMEPGLAEDVPVPTLIDVSMKGKVSPGRLQGLRQQLAAVAPSARVDAQSSWLAPVFDAIQSLLLLALALVVLLAAALSAAVLLAARSALGSSRDTIEIVHLLGGTDAQIARVFQRSIGIDAIIGGVVGLVLAVIVILFLGKQFAELGAGLVESGSLGWSDWLILALVPLISAGLAMATARLTVMHALRKML